MPLPLQQRCIERIDEDGIGYFYTLRALKIQKPIQKEATAMVKMIVLMEMMPTHDPNNTLSTMVFLPEFTIVYINHTLNKDMIRCS